MELSLKLIAQVDLVALYAAVVATVVLLWDAIKWWQSGARLKGKAETNMTTFGMGPMDDDTHVIVDINNVGDRPTTIRGVYLQGYSNLWKRFREKADVSAVINSGLVASYPIPQRLDVGENFQASVIQTPELEEWSRRYRLYAKVTHSTGRPIKMRIQPIKPSDPDAS